MEWDGQSLPEGAGLFPDHRDSKRTGDKRTGEGAGASVRKPKFKTHGHQTQQKVSKPREARARAAGTNPEHNTRAGSAKEESTNITWSALFKKRLITDNFKQIQRK